MNTLKGYATETWVLKQLAKLKPTSKTVAQNIQSIGAPTNADTVDGLHIDYSHTRASYQELVNKGLDDPNTLYLIKN